MSLTQRIWLIVLFLLILAFGSSIVLSTLSVRHHVEQTLRLKNADNASALALTMTQMDKDPTTLKLLLSAQFDIGHYQAMSFRSNDGNIDIKRTDNTPVKHVPGWFIDLIDLDVPAGIAQVQDGWQPFGTLKVKSHYQFAYQTLWTTARNITLSYIALLLLSLLITWLFVRSIRKPLQAVTAQARDIADRRFTEIREPRIRELRDVAQSMNMLSASVQQMLVDESRKLETLQEQIHTDELTGLDKREYFLSRLDSLLQRQDAQASGMLCLIRIPDLQELNQRLGYAATNNLLLDISQQLQTLHNDYATAFSGRLNGSDFAMVIPGDQYTDTLAHTLENMLADLSKADEHMPVLPTSLTTYNPGDTHSELLTALDYALATAEHTASGQIEIIDASQTPQLFDTQDSWRDALIEALDKKALRFGHYPVVSTRGQLLHEESPTRLYLAGEWQPAALFIPWVERFNMAVDFDLQMLTMAQAEVRRRNHPLAVNLSGKSLEHSGFTEALTAIAIRQDVSRNLLLEWPANDAIQHIDTFRELAGQLGKIGYSIGLKHAGPELARLGDMHDLGLNRVKLAATQIRDIHLQTQQQSYVRGICTLLHSLGIKVIAEGVQSELEAGTLAKLGVDGFTGPGVHAPASDNRD